MKCVRTRGKKNLNPKGRVKRNVVAIPLEPEAANDSTDRAVTKTLAECYPGSASEGAYFECDHCKKRFKRKPLLKRHVHNLHPYNLLNRKLAGENVLASLLFECHHCGRKYVRKDYLITHMHAKHFKTEPRLYECRPCDLVWKTRESLRRHLDIVHSTKKTEVERKSSRVIELRCVLCGSSFNQRIKILRHYTRSHQIEIETEQLRFSTEREFIEWKNNIETIMTCSFRKRSHHKCKEHSLTLFSCHRSGSYESRALLRRCLKTSKKMNGFCPGEIKLYSKKDGCHVIFVKTHIGHSINTEEELSHITFINRQDRQRIECRTKAGVPLNQVSKDDEGTADEDQYISEVHLLNCADLDDTSSSDDLKDTSRALPNSRFDLDKYLTRNASSILYYKRLGTLDPEYPVLQQKDIVLIYMNSKQEEMLKEFGHDVIALDVLNSVKNPKFTLQTLLVIDGRRESYPVAFAMSGSNGKPPVDVFLRCVKKKTGSLRPNILMTHLEATYYASWVEIMDELPQTRIYCPWSVQEAWDENAMEIPDEDKRARMMKQLHGISMEPDQLKFEVELNDFLNCDDEEVASFLSSFKSIYLKTVDYWAYCYQIDSGMKTKLHVKSFRKYCKYRFGMAWTTKDLSSGLRTIERTLSRVDVGLKRAEVVEKLGEKLKILRQRHDIIKVNNIGVNLNVYIDTTEVPNEWNVSSFAFQDDGVIEMYVVTQIMQNKCDGCPLLCDECDICLHQFQCTCDDSSVKLNMCVHIHVLGLYLNSLVDPPLVDSGPSLVTSETVSGSPAVEIALVPTLEG